MHLLRLGFLLPVALLVVAITVGCGGTSAPASSKTPPATTSGGTPSPTPPPPTTPTPGPGPTPPPPASTGAEYVYANVGTSDNFPGTIYGFRVDLSNGHLTAVSGSPFAVKENASACSVGCFQLLLGDPQGKYLFSTFNGQTRGMVTFQVDPAAGSLTETSFLPSAAPNYLSADPSGNVILGQLSDGSTSSVDSWTINRAANSLTPAPGSPFPYEAPAQASYIAPAAATNGLVYALSYCSPDCSNDNSQWNGWKLDAATGVLTPLPGFPQAAGGKLMIGQTITPSGQFLYSQEIYFPNGTGFYEIVGYRVNADGTLARLPWTVPTQNQGVNQMVMSPNGNFLINAVNGSVDVYAIDQATGALTLTGSYGGAGTGGASWVVIDPALKYVFLATTTGISSYTVNPTTGALTAVSGGTASLPGTPGSLALVKP